MIEIYSLMFVSGLLGGFGHCIGMCGPVVVAYSVSLGKKSIIPHLLYNAGRVTTYTFLGGVMGITGSFLIMTGRILEIQKIIMISAGALIVLFGLGMGGRIPFIKGVERILADRPFFRKVLTLFSGAPTIGTYFPMGIALGFIPCGLVYTAMLTSARMGMEASDHVTGLLSGALAMMIFGIGTVPALFLFGKIVDLISVRLRQRLYRISAVIMVIMGMIFIIRALKA